MKKIISVSVLAIMILSIATFSLASSLTNYTTTSAAGWIYYNSSTRPHRGQLSSTYYLANNFDSEYNQALMYDAQDIWGYPFLTMTRVTDQSNAVCTVIFGITSDPLRPVECMSYQTSSGHITKVSMVILEGMFSSLTRSNKLRVLEAGIGGAYGLGGVTSGNRVMNWEDGQYPITGLELRGMQVLNHIHTHTSASSTITFSKYDSSDHRCTCSYCNTYFYESHTFSGSSCTKCGYRPVE